MDASGSPPSQERFPLASLAAKYSVNVRTLQTWARAGLPCHTVGRARVTSEHDLLEFCRTIQERSPKAAEILREAARNAAQPAACGPREAPNTFLRDAGRAAAIDALLESLDAAAALAVDVARGHQVQIGRILAAWRANEPPVEIDDLPDLPKTQRQ